MAKQVIEFETSDNWHPLNTGCWTECPATVILKLGTICPAVLAYEKNGVELCPMKRFAKECSDT